MKKVLAWILVPFTIIAVLLYALVMAIRAIYHILTYQVVK